MSPHAAVVVATAAAHATVAEVVALVAALATASVPGALMTAPAEVRWKGLMQCSVQ